MSYLSKQRIERILGRWFDRSWLGLREGDPRLIQSVSNVTIVSYGQPEIPIRLRKEDLVQRVLVDIGRRDVEPVEIDVRRK